MLSWVTTTQQQSFYGPLSGTTRVCRYQKKHSPTRHPDHHPIFVSFFCLLQSIASSLFKLYAWQSFCTTSLHVLFGLPLGMEPFVLDKMLLNDFCYNEIQTMFRVFLWLPLRSTGQAIIMFYYIVSVLFF